MKTKTTAILCKILITMIITIGIANSENIRKNATANNMDIYHAQTGAPIKIEKTTVNENGDRVTNTGTVIKPNGIQEIGNEVYLPNHLGFDSVGIINKTTQSKNDINANEVDNYNKNGTTASRYIYQKEIKPKLELKSYTGIYNPEKKNKFPILNNLGIADGTEMYKDAYKSNVKVYIFPNEENLYYSYQEAANHAVDLYNKGENSKFYGLNITVSPSTTVWPNEPEKQKVLIENGLVPKENYYLSEIETD